MTSIKTNYIITPKTRMIQTSICDKCFKSQDVFSPFKGVPLRMCDTCFTQVLNDPILMQYYENRVCLSPQFC